MKRLLFLLLLLAFVAMLLGVWWMHPGTIQQYMHVRHR